MLPDGIRQFSTGDHDIETILEGLGVKFRVFAGGSVVALEARQDYQPSSQRMAIATFLVKSFTP
jgi:hypothetical protein